MLRLGWFSTGRGSGSRNLLRTVVEKRDAGVLDVEISFVFCNWEPGEGEGTRYYENRQEFFRMVEDYGIPLVPLSWKRFKSRAEGDEEEWRNAYGEEMRRLLADHDFDLGVLAGYMLWIDDRTCEEYDLINLHPALPDGPKGTWEDVIWQLMDERAERQGAMIHLVTPDWDRGPPLTYCGFPITGDGYDDLWESLDGKLSDASLDEVRETEGRDEPLFHLIREDGARRELPLIVQSIKLFADDRVRIADKRLYEGDRPLDGPYDLTEEVDAALLEE